MRDSELQKRVAGHEILLICLLCSVASVPARAQMPLINPQGLVNAATNRSAFSVPAVARGSIVSIYGHDFSTTTAVANSFPLSTQLSGTGTQVLFGGIAAPVFYVSPTQINAQVPFELPDGSSVDLVVRNGFGTSASLEVALLTQDPGIFIVWRLGSELPISPSNPILPGDTIIIWATGLGSVTPPVPSGEPGPTNPLTVLDITPLVKVGGGVAHVEYAGLAPGLVGVYQINATVPADLFTPTADVALIVPGVVGPSGSAGAAGAAGATAVSSVVATSETTTSTTYTDLTTPGPAVTATVSAGQALVTLTAELSNTNKDKLCSMAFEVSGATTIAVSDAQSLRSHTSVSAAVAQTSATYLVTGLNAGSNTFTAKYKRNSNTCTFANRNIIVIPY